MLHTKTLTQTVAALKNKDISHAELYADVQQSIDRQNPNLNVYLRLTNDPANTAEKLLDTPLAGVPIAVKDNFCTAGVETTASAKVLDGFVPPFDSTVTAKLASAGGVMIGKTNMDAWAHGSSTETSDYGTTLNPRNTKHSPGGSSGGSAAAVAADMCIAAIGSETAGSIRLPASWCGTVGLKPTYGRVSRYGVVAMASSTDSPGPLTKTVEDSALLLNHIAGHDPRDATSSPQAAPDFTSALHKDIKGMKIGYIYHELPGMTETYEQFEKELQVFERLGAHVEKATAMDPHYAIGVYTVVQRAEVASNLARYDGIRYGHDRSTFGAEAKRRIMLGTYTLSKGYADQYYNMAQKVRTLFRQDFHKLFSQYDALIALSSPGYALKVGASEESPMFGELCDMLLEASSVSGLPGISVPCYHDPASNLYLGMNIVTPMWQEETAISLAHAYEQATAWNSWLHT